MKTIILAGGQNTRLAPMIHTLPRPLLPVANRPMVEYLLDLLKKNGIREVVLAINADDDKATWFTLTDQFAARGSNLTNRGLVADGANWKLHATF